MGSMKKQSTTELLKQAIAQAGGAVEVARHFEFAYPSAVYNWISARIPADCCKKLCDMKGVKVTPKQLRPDVF